MPSQSAAAQTQPSPLVLRQLPRPFTATDRSLIRRLSGHLPAQQLLDLLNERLAADRASAVRYTLEQLHAELREVVGSAPGGQTDWAGLRHLIAQARRSGLLELITPQVIEDFAVVFALTPAQLLRLKDVLANGRGARAGGAA